ncbi:MAG: NAD(P)/FAD-dependent oxidoreductase [Proteobacteria bacterium]|nr:NAD(P)/FAD-dependent oxidoreductase [Pseudomonadota bacterium]
MSEHLNTLEGWLLHFGEALASGDAEAVADSFLEGGFWRDLVAFTWTLKTLEGRAEIAAMLRATPQAFKADSWRVADAAAALTEGFISFETPQGRGEGYVRLVGGKCLTLLTALKGLKGHEEHLGRNRPVGFSPDPARPLENWRDARRREVENFGVDQQPFVLIVGGGQGGLGLAARLRQLQTPTLIVERNARPGDQWRSRYHSLSLHDPVWYDHMPYLPFPETWPVYTPKDKMGDWLDAYAEIMELNIWCETTLVGAQYDEAKGRWRAELRRGSQTLVLHPHHLVLAVGNAGRPNMPKFPGAETFSGDLLHSSQYRGGAAYAGKRVAVIGSNNSAHDICADLVAHNALATMIQKESTHIIRSETNQAVYLQGSYSQEAVESGVTTDQADLRGASLPIRLLENVVRGLTAKVAEIDADFYARLEAVGFMHDFGEDGTGMPLKYLRRASGYYIDVGAADLVASGVITLVSNVGVERIDADGVVMSDGRKIEADAIVCATGFGAMDQQVADLISPEVAAKVGRAWGYGSGTANDPGPWEGEIRNMWKPTPQQGLWFHGGNLSQSRFFSQFLALQLKARQIGLATPIYDPSRA